VAIRDAEAGSSLTPRLATTLPQYACYCVLTATLVAPRMVLVEPENSAMMPVILPPERSPA
jgi:hypothetical protein